MGMCLATTIAMAQNGVITLESYPTVSVADGRSTLTVTAQLRDNSGRLVPDGTQVIFDTTQGTFREKVLTTSNGYARAVLIAPSNSGVAKIRASALRFNAISELEIEFVADRSMLSSAREYFEIEGSDSLQYAVDDKILEATGENRGAVLKYRDIVVRADDMQVRVPSYELKARRATLEIGDQTYEFDELFLRLNRKTGFGLATVQKVALQPGRVPVGSFPIKIAPYYGYVEISARGVFPAKKAVDGRQLSYQSIIESISRIEAKKAVAFPRKEVQFHDANVMLTGQSLMRTPLFRMPINSSSPIVTDQYINVSNNDLALNYPHYLKLKPGESQLLRFKWGNRYSTGTGATGGTFLDYEWSWNNGEEMDGGFNIYGLGRSDWGTSFRQFWAFQPGSGISFQLDFPAHRSMYATSNLSHQIGKINANLNASYGTSLAGSKVTSDSLSAVFEGDPFKVDFLNANGFFGVTGSQRNLKTPFITNSQQSAGIQSRFVGKSMRFGPGSSLNWSYTFGRNFGNTSVSNFTHLFNVGMSATPLPSLGMNVNYSYTEDGFTSEVLGRHRLGLEAYYNPGRVGFSGSATKSLDVDQLNISARLRYEVGSLWNFYYGYAYDQFGVDSFFDQSFILSYKLGFRELGLSYSQRTKRLGIEILGSSFN